MRIACVGGGPAGLVFAISMKLRDPAHEIVVFERNEPGDTFGWGVVFSDQTWTTCAPTIPRAPGIIASGFAHWDDIDVHIRGADHHLLRPRLLRHRPQAALEHPAGPRRANSACGSTSAPRSRSIRRSSPTTTSSSPPTAPTAKSAQPSATISSPISTSGRTNTSGSAPNKAFDAFTFAFEQTEHGWIWAHAYKFDDNASTFIVECAEPTWRALGFDAHEPGRDLPRLPRGCSPNIWTARRSPPTPSICAARPGSIFPRVLCETLVARQSRS